MGYFRRRGRMRNLGLVPAHRVDGEDVEVRVVLQPVVATEDEDVPAHLGRKRVSKIGAQVGPNHAANLSGLVLGCIEADFLHLRF